MNELKDSGQRTTYETGAVRERAPGKGRYDLISPLALKRLAVILERGCEKYPERNYEKGIPLSRYMDSAFRHLMQYIEGQIDENHLDQCFYNIYAAVHTEEAIRRGILPETLNDLPCYVKGNINDGKASS